MLKARVAGKFYDALDNNEPWAIQMAMRNQFGWDAGRGGFHLAAGALTDGVPSIQTFIEFVVPGTTVLQEDSGPIPGQRLLPPPRRLRKDEMGNWVEDEG